jgi:hypothetical protein
MEGWELMSVGRGDSPTPGPIWILGSHTSSIAFIRVLQTTMVIFMLVDDGGGAGSRPLTVLG